MSPAATPWRACAVLLVGSVASAAVAPRARAGAGGEPSAHAPLQVAVEVVSRCSIDPVAARAVRCAPTHLVRVEPSPRTYVRAGRAGSGIYTITQIDF